MKKFRIPKTPLTEPKCIRFPIDLLEEIDNAISGKSTTFSAFVIEACKFALTELDNSNNETLLTK